jgi:ABC-type multidrug transport system ATPase subunit
MAIVETRGVTKVFKKGELGAVNDVDLVTHEGEFLVFSGRRVRGRPPSCA